MSRSLAAALAPAKPSLSLGPVLDFMRVIWALDHSLQKASKRMMATLGVTGQQRLVIRIVGRFPGITAGQIAQLLHVHPSTLTGIVKRLQRQGLIRKRSDPRDGRRAFLGITEKGREIDRVGEGTVESAVRDLIARTPPARLEAMRQILLGLSSALAGRD